MQQAYTPPDLDAVFAIIELDELEVIFQCQKRRYYKRTSSAQWDKMPASYKFNNA